MVKLKMSVIRELSKLSECAMSKTFDEIAQKAEKILSEYSALTGRLEFSQPGDTWIARNIAIFSDQLRRLAKTARESNLLDAFEADAKPHPYDHKRILEATGWNDSSAPVLIKKWRRNPEEHPYTSVPDELRKEIFDYFFRHDVHGELENDDIMLLSRGINDPEYFRPPTIVNIALDVASKNGWFGYSDSLGHEDTREAIAALERVRRGQNSITAHNAAVVQGGTAGLHAVLSMLCRMDDKEGCVLAAPTYAPILDDVSHHFKPHILELSDDYEADFDKLREIVETENIAAVLISIPHNPNGFRNFDDHLDQLHEVCFKNGVFLICDEIIFDEQMSPAINPIDYPNLIVISSYSKSYSIAGLKLGHILARQDFLNDFYRHASTTYGSPPSFLYLTATCVASMERYARDGTDPNLPEVVTSQFSDPDLILEDFMLWRRLGAVYRDFQNLVVQACTEKLGHTGVEQVMGLDDPSSNIVLRVKGREPAYRTSMDIIAARNVSVMPIECFSPTHEWPRDLRVTIAVEPEELVLGYPQLIAGVDDIVAMETKAQWAHKDDLPWLEALGLTGKVKGINVWGRANRIQERLSQIFKFAGKSSVSESLRRVSTYMSLRQVWSSIKGEQRQALISDLTGRNDTDTPVKWSELIEYFLDRPGRLTDLPEMPDDIKLMLIRLSDDPKKIKENSPELQAVSLAERFQGISLSGQDLKIIRDNLRLFDREQDYDALVQSIEQLRAIEV
nr:aminotransferase class I/II-fold pyridoxal phosphate-dependent enzyme [Cytophagales bacterium]